MTRAAVPVFLAAAALLVVRAGRLRPGRTDVDIYNVFNSDAINSCNTTFTPDNPLTPAVEVGKVQRSKWRSK